MCRCRFNRPDLIHLLFNANPLPLLEMVNEARKHCGEPPVRNNKFIEKVVDELKGGEFYTKSVKRSGTNGGRPGTL
ncbi:TPA: hypothetical protein MH631_07320 [Klebsiella pneumoniae]|nr:hypothetical protein [Klebsiella pneumoniae]